MMKELAGIVDDIQSVAKEAKVVSFNAQVMAARAGQHGREFAVVANVLSDITSEIDRLTRKAAVLAERSRG
ncbi:Methyl-accepting chemotaxis protein 1 [compost metagenome]